MSSQPCHSGSAHGSYPGYIQELLNDGTAQRASQAQAVLAFALIAWAIALCAHSIRVSPATPGFLRPLNVTVLRFLRDIWQLDPELRKHVDTHQLKFWRTNFKGSMVFAVAWLVFKGLSWHDGQGQELLTGRASDDVVVDTLGGSFSLSCWALLSSLVFTTFPSLLTKYTLYAWIALSYVVIQWYTMTTHSLPLVLHRNLIVVLLRVMLSTHCSSVSFIVLLNLFASVHTAKETIEVLEANNYDVFQGRAPLYMVQFVALALQLSINLVNRDLLLHEIRGTMEAKSSRNIKASMERLLRGVCDVTVHLRGDLTLENRCPQLDVLLMRSRGARATEGVESFLDFLYDDGEKQRVRDFLQAEAESGNMSETLHVSMRDAYQVKVPVQLFHSHYLDAMDERFHIIGILDKSSAEERQAPLPADMAAAAPVHAGSGEESLPVGRQALRGAMSSISEQSASVPSNPESVGAEILPQMPDGTPDEASVWINAYEDGMPMVQCSATLFARIGGPSLRTGTKLLSWVPRRERTVVQGQIQQRMNEIQRNPGCVDPGFKVRLRPRHLAGRCVNAYVAVSIPPEEYPQRASHAAAEQSHPEGLEAEDLEEEELCKLVFAQLEVESRPETMRRVSDGAALMRREDRLMLQL